MSTTLPTTIYIDYKFWTDAFTSLVSLAVAFTAVVFTIKQSKATIKHNRLSVTPVICDNLDLFDNTVMYSITNKGLGTASTFTRKRAQLCIIKLIITKDYIGLIFDVI